VAEVDRVHDDHQRIEAVIAAFAAGEIVVVTDDDDRENEGDLFVAASLCTPEKMAFIIRNTSGIVCAPLSAEQARRLHLGPMVAANDAPLGTAFTVSVDCRHGLTTGISAEERTNTVRALANDNSGASDFVRPGHVFPLIAKDGGVLMRSGHTEACIDLCRLAGLPAVGVLAELMNDDGSVMRGPGVAEFAARHKLRQVSIADLIAYRQARDKLVKRIGEFPVKSKIGTLQGYAYVTPFDAIQHMAFVYGRIGNGKDMPARLHRADVIRDVFGGAHPVHSALERFKQEGRGVIVFLRDGAAGVPTHAIPHSGSTGSEFARSRQWREVGLGAQILKDLGIASIRLLTSTRMTYVGLAGFGIEITATELIEDRAARN
jgi:3,4-dihydroxy 2-butanone 4-phosphate synthase/GTP cyclohydrolase II